MRPRSSVSCPRGSRTTTESPRIPLSVFFRQRSFAPSKSQNYVSGKSGVRPASPRERTILYEYIWFGGMLVAQVDSGTVTHWTFTDHLGTPLIQTDTAGAVYWRAEHEPYGRVFALRPPTLADQHQPLRLPGQEAERFNLGTNGSTERFYNIFRWYRSNWGRYTQSDPAEFESGDLNLYRYVLDNPIRFSDPHGLSVCGAAQTLSDLTCFAMGNLPSRTLGSNSSVTQDVQRTPVMDDIRDKYQANGCKDGTYCGDFQYRQLGTTLTIAGQAAGGFCAKLTTLRPGQVLVQAWNDWGLESGTRFPRIPGQATNRSNPSIQQMVCGAPLAWPKSILENRTSGPFQTVRTRYMWMENLCCGCPSP